MRRFAVVSIVVLVATICLGLPNAQAAVQFMNINFDNDTLGTAPSTGALRPCRRRLAATIAA